MKRILLITLLFIPFIGFAQSSKYQGAVLTYSSHGLLPETENAMQPTTFIDPAGLNGEKVVWDFSASTPIEASGKNSEQLSAMPEAYHIKVTNVSGVKFSYLCNSQANIFEGYQDEQRTMVYDIPMKKVIYPFSYGSIISGNFAGRCLYHNSTHESRQTGTYSSEADAYGTLILPTGQTLNNVLRLKTIEKYVEESCANVEIEAQKYLWYVDEYRYPVFVTWDITYTYQDGQTTHTQASFYTLANIRQVENAPTYSIYTSEVEENESRTVEKVQIGQVFPNPYSSYFYLTYTLNEPMPVNIALYSFTGALIKQIVDNVQDGPQHITYNSVGKESPGVYYLRMKFGDKLYVRPLVKD